MRLLPAPWLFVVFFLLLASLPTAHIALSAHPIAHDSPFSAASASPTQAITISAESIDPQAVTITVGTTVRWTNVDDIAHTITAVDGSFGPLSMPGQYDSVTNTFTTTGAYTYSVSPLNLKGLIDVVDGAGSATATPTDTATATATSTPTPTATQTPIATATETPIQTPTGMATQTPTASSTATVMPTASPTATVMPTASPTATATPSSTATPIPTASPTGTPTQTQTPSPSATNTSVPSVAVRVSLIGAEPVPCTPFIPVDGSVILANDNPSGGPSYDIEGVSPISFTAVSYANLTSGKFLTIAGSLFPSAGTYTYSISSSGRMVVPAAQIVVGGNSASCAAPTATVTPTGTPTSTPTATASATPTATFTASATATTTSTLTATPTGTFTAPTITPTDAGATETATPSINATQTATPTLTETLTPTTTQTLTPTVPVPTGTPTATPTNTPTATPTSPPVFTIHLSGAVPQPCTLSIPVGASVNIANDNPPDGPAYYLQGVSPASFASFGGSSIYPGDIWSLPPTIFAAAGMYVYSISFNGRTLVADARIIVGGANVVACPAPTETPTATDVPSGTPTPTNTPIPTNTPEPTGTPSATPSATATRVPTNTPSPTWTPTPLPVATATLTPQSVPPTAGLTPSSAETPATSTPLRQRNVTRNVKHGRPSHGTGTAPCSAASGKPAAIQIAVSSALRRGRAHATLTLSVSLRGGHLHGAMTLRDPGAHLLLTLLRLTRLRADCHGLSLDGVGRAGRRVLPVSVNVQTTPRNPAIAVAIASLRYHVGGRWHGHVVVRMRYPAHKSGATPRQGQGSHKKLAARHKGH